MRAQGGGTGSDAAFISLDVGMVLKGGESRLVREEDELGDGDEGKSLQIISQLYFYFITDLTSNIFYHSLCRHGRFYRS